MVDREGAGSSLGSSHRALALTGVLGPVAFVASWITAGTLADGYSAVQEPISRLAAVGAATAPVMNGGFVTFGAALVVYGQILRRAVPGGAWVAATLSGAATLAVAATPLDRSGVIDAAHGAFAAVGYVAISATPLLAVPALRRAGASGLARLGLAAGFGSAAALALTLTGAATGLLQRLGLTVADAWIVTSALAIASGRVGGAPQR